MQQSKRTNSHNDMSSISNSLKSESSKSKKVKFSINSNSSEKLTHNLAYKYNPNENQQDQQEEEENIDQVDLELKPKKGQFKHDDEDEDKDSDSDDSDNDNDSDSRKDTKTRRDLNDDMFSDTEKEAETRQRKTKFLKSKDIEGQEWTTASDVDETQKHENGGIPIETFNMDHELAEGDFTASGVYVLKKDHLSVHDSWLKGIGNKEIIKAKEAHALLLERQESQAQETFLSPDNCLLEVFGMLQPPESILAAIKRLGAGAVSVPKWKKIKKPVKIPKELTQQEISINKARLDRLTHLATKLFDTNPDIYEMSYADIALHLKQAKLV